MTPAVPSPAQIDGLRAVRAALEADDSTHVVVVGDVMLDRYVDGVTNRLSPEAPVPVIEVTGESDRLGGAANVAVGLTRLGVSVRLVGLVGDDRDAGRIHELLAAETGVGVHLLTDPARPTTTKERVRVDGRHVLRIDREETTPLGADLEATVVATAQELLAGARALVVSDYAKGAVVPDLVSRLDGRPCTVVDPKHHDVERYHGADVLAPNRDEATGGAADPDAVPLDEAVRSLHHRLPGTAIVVTAGPDGLVWSDAGEGEASLQHLPSFARRVLDVTGAGDSVMCGLTASLATGADLATASFVAQAAAAVAVETLGTAAPSWAEIDDLVAARTR